jgi:hypothetical protein
MKQYDFTREVQPLGQPFRQLCIEAVRSICWHDIFGSVDEELLDGWGEGGPDWQAWEETYGQYPSGLYSDWRPRFEGVAQVMRFCRARRRDRKLLSN